MIQSILLSFFANAYNRILVVGIALLIIIATTIYIIERDRK